jgi:hypothetical protein
MRKLAFRVEVTDSPAGDAAAGPGSEHRRIRQSPE